MANHRTLFVCIVGAALGACSADAISARKSRSSPDLEVLEGANAAPEAAPTHPLDAEVRGRVVRELARRVGAEYVFPAIGAELETRLLELLAAGAYDSIQEARELAEALTRDLWRIAKDKHLRVELGPPRPQGAERRPSPTAGGIRKVEVLPGNVGYLALQGVPPLQHARAAISGAFALLQGTDALLIDNRDNHGGDPGTVAYYVSYLTQGEPFVVSRIHFRGDVRVDELRSTDLGERSYGTERPVFVLDSANTFSGGEDLSYALQALGRAKVVGEVSAGGAHPTMVSPLERGLMAAIPFARTVNPITGTNWEGVGVVPDVAAPAEHALTVAERLARAAIAERRQRSASHPGAIERRGVTQARIEPPSASRAPNQVTNGDFSRGLEPWGVTRWGAGPLAAGIHPHHLDGGRLCFSVEPSARILVGWPPETSSHAIVLERDGRYQLSFEASASGSLPIAAEVTVGHRLPPYTPVTTAQIALDERLQSFTVDVDPEEADDQVGLAFKLTALGAQGQTEVCIDEVALRQR